MTFTGTTVGSGQRVEDSIRFWAMTALVLYVLSGLAFAGFSYLGDSWGAASDATAVLLAAVLLILVLRFDDLFAPQPRPAAGVAKWLGVLGTAVAIVGGMALLLGQAGLESILMGVGLTLQFVGWGMLGVWFILIADIGVASGRFRRRWAWTARLAGGGQILAMAATIPLGPESALASTGYGIAFFAVIAWTLWTRSELS